MRKGDGNFIQELELFDLHVFVGKHKFVDI